jgi:glucosamine-6-phosphate deaminase
LQKGAVGYEKSFPRALLLDGKGGAFLLYRRWKDKVRLPHGDAEDPEAEGKKYEDLIQSLEGSMYRCLELERTAILDLMNLEVCWTAEHQKSSWHHPQQRRTPDFLKKKRMYQKSCHHGCWYYSRSGGNSAPCFRKNKAHAVKCMLEGDATSSCPASALQKHPKVTVVADREALSEMQ